MKDDNYLTKAEIDAYRNLDGAEFDFGNGVMKSESPLSEDAHMEMLLEVIFENYESEVMIKDEEIDDFPSEKPLKSKNRNKRKESERKKKKLEKLAKHSYFVYEVENEKGKYFRNYNLSNRRKHAKKQTNKKTRKSKDDFKMKGTSYRRKYDYWWDIF